jgi:hypothetical protein
MATHNILYAKLSISYIFSKIRVCYRNMDLTPGRRKDFNVIGPKQE